MGGASSVGIRHVSVGRCSRSTETQRERVDPTEVGGLFYVFSCIVSWTVPPLMFPTWNVSA